MALTIDKQAQVDIQTAVENVRHANQLESEAKRAKLEVVRLAKEILVENARSLPADSREVTAAAVTAFATILVNYVND